MKKIIFSSGQRLSFEGPEDPEDPNDPKFSQPLENITVSQGRDVTFTCVVDNIGQYKVSSGF